MTTIRTNSKAFLNKLDAYIFDCISLESYNIDTTSLSNADKLKELIKIFKYEYWFDANKVYYKGNIVAGFSNWLQGLPSVFNIDFENYRILEIAKDWDSLSDTASEKQEGAVIANWFNLIANRVFKLAN